MNKIAAGIVIIVILALGGWAIHNHKSSPSGSNSGSNTNMSGSSQPQTNNSNSQNNQATTEGKVSIQNMLFTPSQVAIQKGGTVTWTNNDSVTHTVTSDDGTSFDSGDLAPGKTFSHTFNTAGSFPYHCTIHSYMHGTIVVQ